MGQLEIVILFTDSRLLKKRRANHLFCLDLAVSLFKVSVKENEVPTEKNSSRASIFATNASYISN